MRWKVNFSIACIFNPMLSVTLIFMITIIILYFGIMSMEESETVQT